MNTIPIKGRTARRLKGTVLASKRAARTNPTMERQDAAEVPLSRQQGSLSSAEIEKLLVAYSAGATGHLLVGLSQQTRLLTVMVPAQASEAQMAHRMEAYAARLRALRCDGYIHVRRVHLRRSSRQTITAMLMEQYLQRQYRQQSIELDTKKPDSGCLRDNPIQDAVSQVLQRAFDNE